MFSKLLGRPQARQACAVILVVVSVAGCRWGLGSSASVSDDNPAQTPVSLNLSRYTCLRQLDQSVTEYFEGNLPKNKVTAIMKCVRDALTRFKDLTKDSKDGTYSPEGLRGFLNKVYLTDRPLPTALMTEMMGLKTILLGGEIDKISRSELDELISLVLFVEEQAIANLPYIKMYGLKQLVDAESITKHDLTQARLQLQESLVSFAKILQSREKTYSMKSLSQLASEINKYLNVEKTPGASLDTDQGVELFKAVKGLVAGNNVDAIYPQDWALLADAVSLIYGIYLSYEVRIKERSFMFGPALDTFLASANDAFSFIENVIKRNPKNLISFSEIENLATTFQDLGILTKRIRISSLVPVYTRLITVGLRAPKEPRDRPVQGLGLNQLAELRKEFDIWANGQKYLSDNARRNLPTLGALDDSGASGLQRFKDILKSINSFDFTKFILNSIDAKDPRGDEIAGIVRHVRPLYRDGDERTYLVPLEELGTYGVQNSLHGLTRLNLMNTLARILIRSFAAPERVGWLLGTAPAGKIAGITQVEMDEFYALLRPLGEDLAVMDPRKPITSSRYFVDGNIFTFSGNGFDDEAAEPSLLTKYETIELLAILWSSAELSHIMFKDIAVKCAKPGVTLPLDVFKNPKIKRECFFKHFRDKKFSEYSNMPHLVEAIGEMNEQKYAEFLVNLQAISRIDGEDQTYIEDSELGSITGTLQYIEVLFSLYDKKNEKGKRDGVLESRYNFFRATFSNVPAIYEAMLPFKRFSGFINRCARLQSRSKETPEGEAITIGQQKGVFAYLVENGRLPEAWYSKPNIFVKDVIYFNEDPDQYEKAAAAVSPRNLNPDWVPTLKIDRLGVLRVLRILSEQSTANKPL